MEISRRDFLRLMAGTGSGTALSGLIASGVNLVPTMARAQQGGSRTLKPRRACVPTARWAAPRSFTHGKLVNMTPAIFVLGGATLAIECNHIHQKLMRGLGVVASENQARI